MNFDHHIQPTNYLILRNKHHPTLLKYSSSPIFQFYSSHLLYSLLLSSPLLYSLLLSSTLLSSIILYYTLFSSLLLSSILLSSPLFSSTLFSSLLLPSTLFPSLLLSSMKGVRVAARPSPRHTHRHSLFKTQDRTGDVYILICICICISISCFNEMLCHFSCLAVPVATQ